LQITCQSPFIDAAHAYIPYIARVFLDQDSNRVSITLGMIHTWKRFMRKIAVKAYMFDAIH